jgi:short-subunit dehydrogenase involved in D-alanine esterification of teichoic acids
VQVTGHRILITGGASGIGLALARAFHAAGDNAILLCGRDAEKLDRVDLPGLRTVVADVTRAEDRDRIATTLESELGGLSLLVNNAGVQFGQDYASGSVDEAKLRAEIETDLIAPMLLTARLMPLLRAAQGAGIVNISSGLALIPKPGAPGYCAAKAGLRAFSIALRAQLAPLGIRVFEVLPGQIRTETTWGTMPGEAFAAAVLAAIRAERAEILPGKMAPLALLQRASPALAARVVRRMAQRSARLRAAAAQA